MKTKIALLVGALIISVLLIHHHFAEKLVEQEAFAEGVWYGVSAVKIMAEDRGAGKTITREELLAMAIMLKMDSRRDKPLYPDDAMPDRKDRKPRNDSPAKDDGNT